MNRSVLDTTTDEGVCSCGVCVWVNRYRSKSSRDVATVLSRNVRWAGALTRDVCDSQQSQLELSTAAAGSGTLAPGCDTSRCVRSCSVYSVAWNHVRRGGGTLITIITIITVRGVWKIFRVPIAWPVVCDTVVNCAFHCAAHKKRPCEYNNCVDLTWLNQHIAVILRPQRARDVKCFTVAI